MNLTVSGKKYLSLFSTPIWVKFLTSVQLGVELTKK